ncbi:helix-turn-helix domain-containing protein [Roseibium sediminis]|uniref:helix-turn-helix domain-containing protein n=1 Tax=Roseibium sediminis TaxID=1775174 RepID=UPI003CC801BC
MRNRLLGELLARPERKADTPIGQRLREIRKRFGDPPRDEFAVKLGVNLSTIARYERGEMEPSCAVLAAYADEFQVNLNWLITGSGKMLVGDETSVGDLSLGDVRKLNYNIAYAAAERLSRRVDPSQFAETFVEAFDHLFNEKLLDRKSSENVVGFASARLKRASAQDGD